MKSTHINIGDIYEVKISQDQKKYFQYIAVDQNQLQSDVIRVFSDVFDTDVAPSLNSLIQRPIDFYAHCLIKAGIKYKVWQRVGNADSIGSLDILFRSSKDFGRPDVTVSERWKVWKPNQAPIFVGKLSGSSIPAEPGEVFPPDEIIYRMIHGHYKQQFQK